MESQPNIASKKRKGGMRLGQKTKKTLIREEVEKKSTELTVAFFTNQVAERGPKLIEVIFDQAINEGCRASQKLIMDRFAPAAKAVDGNLNKGDLNIQINVGKLEPEVIEVKGDDDEDENG